MNSVIYSSATDEWATPQDLFDSLDSEFHFTLDPCANEQNHKCERYYSSADDGLSKNWGGAERVLQPSVWAADRQVGAESIRGITEARNRGGNAHSGKDGYDVVPRLHLR